MMIKRKNKFTMKIFDEFSTPITKEKGTIEDLQNLLKKVKRKFS